MSAPVVAVFVPGLMGAGILVSIAMLVADGMRRLRPAVRGRARVWVQAVRAQGRVHDLVAVHSGEAPVSPPLPRVTRPRPAAFLLGVLAIAAGVAALLGAFELYRGSTGALGNRGWTIGAGLGVAVPLGGAGVVWLAAASLGASAPGWLRRIAATGVLGTLPDPDT